MLEAHDIKMDDKAKAKWGCKQSEETTTEYFYAE